MAAKVPPKNTPDDVLDNARQLFLHTKGYRNYIPPSAPSWENMRLIVDLLAKPYGIPDRIIFSPEGELGAYFFSSEGYVALHVVDGGDIIVGIYCIGDRIRDVVEINPESATLQIDLEGFLGTYYTALEMECGAEGAVD